MTKEKIIAGIEKYVDSLNENEKSTYKQAIKDFSFAKNEEVKRIYPIVELAFIVRELQKEIKEQAQKETKGNSFVKRSKLITKLLEKSYNEKFNKGFIEEIDGEKMKCCIIDGYYAFMLNDIDIPMIAEGAKQEFSVNKVLPDYKNFEVCDFDIAEIKAALKLYKAKPKSERPTRCLIVINSKKYDAEFFINVIDGLGGEITMYQNPVKMGVDVFESENGKALLCPCRP